MPKRFKICIVWLYILTPLAFSAGEFEFEHSDCTIRYVPLQSSEKLNSKAQNLLKEHDYKVKPLIDGKRLLVGEMYFTLEKELPKKKLYSACVITVKIKKAKGNQPRMSDKVHFAKTIKRTVPRITFKGSERCNFAIKEAFIHIPSCKVIGFAGEKR